MRSRTTTVVWLVALALLLAALLPAGALAYENGGWSMQTTPVTNALTSISFADATHGWAVGDAGRILATSDGGASWSRQYDDAFTYGLNHVDAMLVGPHYYAWAVGNSGKVLRTFDGGASWSEVGGLATNYDVYSVDFVDNNGWATAVYWGAYGSSSHEILYSSDHGATWTVQPSTASRRLSDVDMVTTSFGCVVGNEGQVFVTTNGGLEWVKKSLDASFAAVDLYSVSFVSTTTGWACGYLPGTGGIIIKTVDGGTTWTNVHTYGVGTQLYGIHATDATHVWAVGSASDGVGAGIVASKDGGTTWIKQYDASNYTRRAVDFVDNTRGWTAGSNGSIWATTTGGWVPAITITAPTAASSWPTNTSQTVSWTTGPTDVGEFKVWLVSAGGTWYLGKSVPPVAGQSIYNAPITLPATMPPGPGYKAYVYYRPTAGSGSWTAQARSAAFTVTPGPPLITITQPIVSSSWPSGSTQFVTFKLSNAAPGGEFKVWLVSSAGTWYVGKQVLPGAGKTSYSTAVLVSCPAGAGYKAYVYWRPTVGTGAWASTARSAAFTVTPVNITSPTASSSWPLGSSQTISWTINPTVSSGEFKVWLVSASGAWYFGRLVTAVGAQPTYSLPVTLSVAGMTAGTYKAYVYYRPTVGSGSWTIMTIGAAFAVTTP